jgi:hypothetical protein
MLVMGQVVATIRLIPCAVRSTSSEPKTTVLIGAFLLSNGAIGCVGALLSLCVRPRLARIGLPPQPV